jgi:hypothetical protein
MARGEEYVRLAAYYYGDKPAFCFQAPRRQATAFKSSSDRNSSSSITSIQRFGFSEMRTEADCTEFLR